MERRIKLPRILDTGDTMDSDYLSISDQVQDTKILNMGKIENRSSGKTKLGSTY